MPERELGHCSAMISCTYRVGPQLPLLCRFAARALHYVSAPGIFNPLLFNGLK